MEPSQHTFVAETGQPTQRRKKARLACSPCRARKTGCDGGKPVCSACYLRGWADKCFYPNSVMQPSTALTLVDIDRRLQRLENAQASQDASRSSPSSSAHHLDAAAHDAAHAGSASAGTSFGHSAMDERPSDDPVAARPNHSHDLTMSSESPASQEESTTFPNLYGFAQHASESPPDEFSTRNVSLPLLRPEFADELLRCYWQNFHSLFPILHWPMFQSKHRAVWKQKPPPRLPFDDILFFATVNMVMALACLRFDPLPLEQRQDQAEEFYHQSLRLVSMETLGNASIPVVQLLLLRGLYLYFADKADPCWLTSGAAIRVAIGLGLNLEPKEKLSQLQREMRRRIWYGGCVALDQVVSFSFSRPSFMPPSLPQPPLPLAIDEEYLSETGEGRQPEGVPSRMDMMMITHKTVEIVQGMSKVRTAPPVTLKLEGGDFAIPEPSAILQVNSMIDDIFHELPEHLRLDADYSKMSLDEDTVKFFQAQSHAIRYRLLILRVSLLRPSILAEAHRWTNPAGSSPVRASSVIQERFHHEICMLCLKTVHTMLDEIHRSPTSPGMSAWYSLNFAFSSATALLVATLSPNLGVSLDMEPARSSWDRAVGILDFHKAKIVSAAKGLKLLQCFRENIRRKASARLSRSPPPPDDPHHAAALAPNRNTCVPTTTMADAQCAQNVTAPPMGYMAQPQHHHHQQQQQLQQPQPFQEQFGHVPGWDGQQHALPTPPPMGGAGVIEGIDPYLGTSGSLDDAWLAAQNYGQNNWILDQFLQ